MTMQTHIQELYKQEGKSGPTMEAEHLNKGDIL